MELRTEAPGTEKQAKKEGDLFDKALRHVQTNLQGNPKAQAKLAQGLKKQYGLDPSVLVAVMPDLDPDTVEAAEAPQGEPEATTPAMRAEGQDGAAEPEERVRPPNVDELMGFLEELMDYTSPETTLAELQEFGEENPDLVQTAIDLRF